MALNDFLDHLTRRVAAKYIIKELVKKKIIQVVTECSAPHAVGIFGPHAIFEVGIDKIVFNVATQLDHCNFFFFRTPLHIPSQWLHEDSVPELKKFLKSIQFMISLHGTSRNDIFVGGKNNEAVVITVTALRDVKWDQGAFVFSAPQNQDVVPELAGVHEDNLVNFPPCGGVQIELPKHIRLSPNERQKFYGVMKKLYPKFLKMVKESL